MEIARKGFPGAYLVQQRLVRLHRKHRRKTDELKKYSDSKSMGGIHGSDMEEERAQVVKG